MPKPITQSCASSSPPAAPLQRAGEVAGGVQGEFDFSSPLAYIVELYAATAATVAEHFGQDALAADMGVSRQVLNLRLRRAQDSKGDVQRLHLDAVGHVLCDAAARWDWLTRINKICGAKPPEPMRRLTDTEKLRIVAGELSEKQRRRLERENGLQAGSLDP